MNDIQKEENQNEIENWILNSQEDNKKKYFCYKLPKSLLKSIKLDNGDKSWVFDYCKNLTTKKINVKIYKKAFFSVLFILFIDLIIFSIDICLFVIKKNYYWWVFLIILFILFIFSIFSIDILSKNNYFSKKRNTSVIDIYSEYWNCKGILFYNNFLPENMDKNVSNNILNNMFEFVDDNVFKNFENYRKNKLIKFNLIFKRILLFLIIIFQIFKIFNFAFIPIFISQNLTH